MKYLHKLEFDTEEGRGANVECVFEADTTGRSTRVIGFYSINSTEPLSTRDMWDLMDYVFSDRKEWRVV